MKVYIEKEDKDIELEFSGPVIHLLRKLNINPADVFVVKNGISVEKEEKLANTDHVKILEIFMGG